MNIWISLALTLALAVQQAPPPPRAVVIVDETQKLLNELRALLAGPDVVVVRAGQDLQATLDNVAPGTRVQLEGRFVGNFKVRRSVILETFGLALTPGLPSDAEVAKMAQLVTPNNDPALWLMPGVGLADVVLHGIHLEGPAHSGVLLIGGADATQKALDQVPQRIYVQYCSIKGPGAANGIGLHGADVTVHHTRIRDVAKAGVESHGILSFNGPGPFRIEDNQIFGSSIGILFGGADPPITGLIPADITIARNIIQKHADWSSTNHYDYAPKNALEWKVGRRIVVDDNTIDTVKAGGQPGFAILVTPSQYGKNPGAIVEDLLITNNTVRNVGGVFNILGHGQNQSTRPTLVSRRLTIRGNWFQCDRALGAHGALAQVANGPIDLVFEQNTVQCNGDAVLRTADTTPLTGFKFTGNLVPMTGTYFTFLSGGVSRGAGLDTRMPGAVFTGNALGGFVNSSGIPVTAHPTVKTNLPQNLYLTQTGGTSEGIVDANGAGIGDAAGYGRSRP